MSDPLDVPRPQGLSSDFADRLRALRSDARVGAAVLLCVAIAAGVAWFRAGIAPSATAAAARVPAASGAPADASGGSRPASGGAPSTTDGFATTSTTSGAIVVDVVGAVRAAGVVSLPASARVIDAIRAAGGATAGADLSRLNLAAKLSDGARVAVPRAGENPPAIDPNAVSGAVSGGDQSAGGANPLSGGSAAPVDINTATVDQLEALPGIGPTLAGAIVQERERNGPFRSVADLTRVPGIGDGRLAQLRDLVSV
jgi:competence protein ComEA